MVKLRQKCLAVYSSHFLENITVDEMGVEEMGVDKMGVDEMGSR